MAVSPSQAQRRRFLGRAAFLAPASLALSLLARAGEANTVGDRKPRFADRPPLVPIDARADRIVERNV